MTEQTNTPELRFPGFNGEWRFNKLGDLTTKIGSGKTPKGGSQNYLNAGIPFLRSQNIQNGKLNLDDLVYIDSKTDETMKNSKSYFGDILLNITGASIGRSAINSIDNTHINLNQHVCIIRLKKQFSYKFLGNFLLSPRGQKKIFKAQSGGSREGLNFKEIANINLYIPDNFNEQEKLGKFFSKLDQQIELEEKKLELLEQQKRGYMQKIFSQELQFKDKVTNNFDNWSEFKIKDIFSKIESGNRLPKSNLLDGDIPYVIAQTTNNGVYMNISKDTLDYHGNNLKKFKKGSITISIDNPDAMFIQTQDFVTSNVMRVLYNENLSIEAHTFILYSLRKLTQTYNWSVKFSGPIIMDSKIKLPVKLNTNDIDWNIVNKIGEFLTKLDFKIYQNTTKVELLKQRKKGLLQKMFV